MSNKARIVIAISMQHGVAVVVATDSTWVASEVDAISAYTDDIGILEPKEYDNDPGLYLWEGTLKTVTHGGYDGYEPETEYTGTLFRPVYLGEMAELLAMCPPDEPTEEAT